MRSVSGESWASDHLLRHISLRRVVPGESSPSPAKPPSPGSDDSCGGGLRSAFLRRVLLGHNSASTSGSRDAGAGWTLPSGDHTESDRNSVDGRRIHVCPANRLLAANTRRTNLRLLAACMCQEIERRADSDMESKAFSFTCARSCRTDRNALNRLRDFDSCRCL